MLRVHPPIAALRHTGRNPADALKTDVAVPVVEDKV